MVGRPILYNPQLDPEIKADPAGSMSAGLWADLKWWIEFHQSWIGLLSRIKEMAKDDPEIRTLCRDIIQAELFLIKLSWWGINDIL